MALLCGGDAARHFSTDADTLFLAGRGWPGTPAAPAGPTGVDDEEAAAAAVDAVLLLEVELEVVAVGGFSWLLDDIELTDCVRNLSYCPLIESRASRDSREAKSVCNT